MKNEKNRFFESITIVEGNGYSDDKNRYLNTSLENEIININHGTVFQKSSIFL